MCVGLLYTEVVRESLGPRKTSMSKMGMGLVRNCWMCSALLLHYFLMILIQILFLHYNE